MPAPVHPIRLALIAGFVGAGKTTFMARAALRLSRAGKRVGLITNDLAPYLADTSWLVQQGFNVVEVNDGGFGPSIETLVEAANRLATDYRPEVILAESAGLSADLSATVIQTFKYYHAERFRMAPLVVLIDPARLPGMLGEAVSTLPLEVSYLFRKQLEEADVLVLNKADQLQYSTINAARSLLVQQFPGKTLLAMSARTGDGLDPVLDELTSRPRAGQTVPSADYQLLAVGQAALAWLNVSVPLRADRPLAWRDLLAHLMAGLRDTCQGQDTELAHLKIHIAVGDRSWHGSLCSNTGTPVVQGPTPLMDGDAMLTLNARVATSPEVLSNMVETTLRDFGKWFALSMQLPLIAAFSPPYPHPKYRFVEPYEAAPAE